MSFTIHIQQRDFSEALVRPEVVFGQPDYSWDVTGGPDRAMIPVQGEDVALWEFIELLRCPVEIYSQRLMKRVWWGFLHDVTINVGDGIQVTVSLEQMGNRVAVVYSYVEPGSNEVGTRLTTGYAQNDDSVATYGTKEKRLSMPGMQTAAAEQLRDTELDLRKYPRVGIDFMGLGKRGSGKLGCRGWKHTLGWQFANRNAGRESFMSYNATQNLGEAAGNTKIEQSFQLTGGEAWKASIIKVRIQKAGSPADTVYCRLYTDSGGSPGSLLATGSNAAADIPTAFDWLAFELDSEVDLALGSTYHIEISRSGANDAMNYYTVSVDEGLGYASGSLQLWNGSAWAARDPDADLSFQVGGVEETTDQISYLLTNYAQFIAGVDIQDASGMATNQYRDGDSTCLAEVEDLLKLGTNNDRRLLLHISEDRYAHIYEEPAFSESNQYYLLADGSLHNMIDAPVEAEECTVGVWAALKDIIPGSVDTNRLATPSPVFIERAEYNGRTGMTTYTPRGLPQPWDLFKVNR